MKQLIILFTMFFAMTTLAGVVGRDVSGDGTSAYKGVFSEVVCDKGIQCSRSGEKLVIKQNMAKSLRTFASGDATPSVANNTWFQSFLNNTKTITTFDDGVPGQEIIVFSRGAITYDVTGTALYCGTTDIVTASNDVTRWVSSNGVSWDCTARVKASGNMN